MPIDRAFTMAGFGLVVTGSLVGGGLAVGEELELVPGPAPHGGKSVRARVRSLQQHGRPVQSAGPGSRVAVNLQGLRPGDAARGQVLAPPRSLPATRCIDVQLRVLQGAEALKHNAPVVLYAGTAEVQAHVRLLDGDAVEPGATAYVQVRLDAALAVRDGDRFVIRRPSPPATIGGGSVVDAARTPPPPAGGRHRPRWSRAAGGGRLPRSCAGTPRYRRGRAGPGARASGPRVEAELAQAHVAGTAVRTGRHLVCR